jgi:molecular chaperone GrpE
MDGTEDVEFEPEEAKAPFGSSPDDASDAASRVKKLRDEIAGLRKEKQEYMDGWQRAKADYVNALKRFDHERSQERVRGVVRAIEALLPALDALERAKAGGEVPAGFASIAKQLESAFGGLGLEAVGAVGERFDPALHEALGEDKTKSQEEDDTVSAVLETGWKIGETLIRPAKVRIYHA